MLHKDEATHLHRAVPLCAGSFDIVDGVTNAECNGENA